MKNLMAFVAGLLFAIGLIISGMSNPAKVLNFLDVFGSWDPSLAFVMGAALLVTIPGFYVAKKRPLTWSGLAMQIPTAKDLDRPLIVGSLMFGIGWGLVGLCPGPALVVVWTATKPALIFAASLLAGMFLFTRTSAASR